MVEKPNIIYIHSHDPGRYIQPYGHPVPTPNLQRLAEEGMLFRQAFCAAPTCSPSRGALVTGQAPHSCGQFGLLNRGFVLRDVHKHFALNLKAAGYSTNLCGMQHVVKDPNDIYDNIINHKAQAMVNAPRAVEFLNGKPEEPFLLTVGFFETHRKFADPGRAEDPRYTLPPHPFPDTPQTREDMAAYKASARILDQGMGMVFDALDANGLAQNTLVICTTDHGLANPYMKCNLTDHGTGVMLIIRGPDGFTGGKVSDALVSHIDLFPTIFDVAGIDPPDWLQGKSLTPLANGESDEINEEVYSDVNFHVCYEPQRMVRTRRWKYWKRFDDHRTPVLPNCDDSPTKSVWLDHGWKERPIAEECLFDLAFDPNETNNVAGDPEHQNVLGDMRGRLNRWMEHTDDPLLQGPIVPPAGSNLNRLDDHSPGDPTYTVE